MAIQYVCPDFEVVRNDARCIRCQVCARQCANLVHSYDEERDIMLSDESRCVNCQRCVSLCPTRALKIVKSDCRLRENANWDDGTIREVYKQAGSGGVLLSSMGNPKPLPVYWDKILINASQVTNPSIDPLREPMETRVFLGKKPRTIGRNDDGTLSCEMTPQLELSMPIMFSGILSESKTTPSASSPKWSAQTLSIGSRIWQPLASAFLSISPARSIQSGSCSDLPTS